MILVRKRWTRFLPAFIALAFSGGCLNAADPGGNVLGRIVVRVSDQNNVGVQDIALDLMLTNRQTIWRTARTGTDGTAQFASNEGGVILQNYIVRVHLTPQWQFASGNANDKPVTPIGGETVTIEFKLEPVVIGGT
ncbi:MAG TPA: hypothetical protein VIF83_14460 [Gemmatimonadaceae bacterium]|jgi:hypothetical protein